MQILRPTKLSVNTGAISENLKKIISSYPGYSWRIGVIKADCYGFHGEKVAEAFISGGCNMLAVSSIEEALRVRESFPDIPILILIPTEPQNLSLCRDKGISVTVADISQAQSAKGVAGLKVHIRANGGHDILGGPTNKKGFNEIYECLTGGECELEGIFLHNYFPENSDFTLAEYTLFEEITGDIDLSRIKIVSTSNSLSLPRFDKRPYCNSFRVGNMAYGIENENLHLLKVFRLTSSVLSVFTLNKGQSLSYGGAYTAKAPLEHIAAVPIGFGDGFIKQNAGRYVFIGDKRFDIITVTMDITLIKVDEGVHQGDEVVLIDGAEDLERVAKHLLTSATEEAISCLGSRVRREYIGGKE